MFAVLSFAIHHVQIDEVFYPYVHLGSSVYCLAFMIFGNPFILGAYNQAKFKFGYL